MLSSLQTISKYTPLSFVDNNQPHISPETPVHPFSTLNSQGYMLADLHKISRAFVEFSSLAPGPVLDIGTANGYVALEALKRGASVIANDMESKHLENLRRRVPKKDLKRISFVVGQVPWKVSISHYSLGAVLASGVLHYLSPIDFSFAIKNIATWLKSGGKFFLATPSPYTNVYQKIFSISKPLSSNSSVILFSSRR